MGLKGQDAMACWGGLGTYVTRGEHRVSELECHANCLRQRLDHLEGMLPSALIEATIAVEKGEDPPDLLKLAIPPEKTEDSECQKEGVPEDVAMWMSGDNTVYKNKNEGQDRGVTEGINVDNTQTNHVCGQAFKTEDYLSEEDEPQVCMLRSLAKKEKYLRKKIFDMECKEEAYMKALNKAEKRLDNRGGPNKIQICKPDCDGTKNPIIKEVQASKQDQDNSVQRRIQQLEANNKKISVNLKNLQRERAELSHQANALTEELRTTQKCLGEVQGKVLGAPSTELIPIMGEPSMEGVCEPRPPCCLDTQRMKPPRDPEALRCLAGQFKAAYQKAEDQGLNSCMKEPIRKAAERLRALSNAGDECPCGEPVKCDSCIICSCAEWEHDLEGGGDEPEVENPYENHFERKPHGPTERCHCGCYETSSESECTCGCRENIVCDEICGQTVGSTGASTSDPTTITDTTIPSNFTSENEDEANECIECCICTTDQIYENSCKICKGEPPSGNATDKEENCELCRFWESEPSPKNIKLCTTCACECTTCETQGSPGRSPPCLVCQPANRTTTDQKDDSFNCSCPRPPDAPPEIQKVCKVGKLREGLENLKNRNHALRKLLKSCGCLPRVDPSCLADKPPEQEVCHCPGTQGPIKQTTSGLISTVRLLQEKCRTKDGMIIALADELKRGATPAQTNRIFGSLADPGLCCRVNDFDRSELWKYLRPLDRSNNARDPDEPELANCFCRTESKEPQPPREISVVGRVSGDILIVTWRPPLSGPVAGYEVLVDTAIVCRVRTPRRTEALLDGLDLRSPKLIEVRTIGPNGLHSVTIEKLFNPARCS